MLSRLRWLLAILCAIHLVRYWCLPGFDSLWIDETGTWWTIADGWRELWARTRLHPNSRFYGALLLGWTQLAGSSEIAMRLPSLAAMLAALAGLGVWMERRFGGGMGWVTAAIWLASPELSFFALEARPYALALLLLVAATLAWMELCREWSLRAGLVWMVCAGLLVQVQALVAAGLMAHVVWLPWMAPWREWGWRRWCLLGALMAGAAILALPEAQRLSEIPGGIKIAAIPARPGAWWRLDLLVPPAIAGPVVVAALALWASRGVRRGGWGAETSRHVAMGVSLAGVMAATLLLYGLVARANVFHVRYALAILVGWMIALPAVLAAVSHARGRVWFATCYSAAVLAASLVKQGALPVHADVDWRGAMAAVREWENGRPAPLLMHSGFVEAANPRLLRSPEWKGFLQAPATYYRPAGPTLTLPYYTLSRQKLHFDEVLSQVSGGRFTTIVYADSPGSSAYVPMLSARYGEARLLGRFRRVEAYAFGPR